MKKSMLQQNSKMGFRRFPISEHNTAQILLCYFHYIHGVLDGHISPVAIEMSTYDLEYQLDFSHIALYARQEQLEKLKQAYERSNKSSSY
jgi:hypothetical protein